MRPFVSALLIELLALGCLIDPATANAQTATTPPSITAGGTVTPIKHVVVIFQENVSFDHYFGTYPNAMNSEGEPGFTPRPGTPNVNGLNGALLLHNPNSLNRANGSNAINPFRLSRSEAATADQDHNYTDEQLAFHGGLMDGFPGSVGVAGAAAPGSPVTSTKGVVMGYYDGSTVTALWNYAQRYAMNDNSFGTTFGPSTPGALNLISGQTNGITSTLNGTSNLVDDGNGSFSVINDGDPIGDVCSSKTAGQFTMSGANIGDLLNRAGVSWGFFSGGFDLTITNADGTTGCSRTTTSNITNVKKVDYIPHHQPFQYYKSTANPTHARPTSVASIGTAADTAGNHQYDVNDFFTAVTAGNYPAVSFLKAPGYQDGHAGYSDPLDEQQFLVHTVNFLQQQKDWNSTAIVILYDDSDGWYDHQMSPIVNPSTSAADGLITPGNCGDGSGALPGVTAATTHAQGRCGYGPRMPFLVISPWAKKNYVDHTLTDQTSPIRFIEDNWLGGQRIGQGSFDAIANSITSMLDFSKEGNKGTFVLDEGSGLIVSETNPGPKAKP